MSDTERKSLREWMDATGWSERRLATALGYKHHHQLSRYSSGERVPDVITAEAIAQHLRVRVGQIIWGRADLQRHLLERLENVTAMSETNLLADCEDMKAARQELERLERLGEVALLDMGWVRVE